MENKCYRATINTIPKDLTMIKTSSIPLFISIELNKEDLQVPIVCDDLVRCVKCKGYLNPYVEIINPGYKWKCNLCDNINEVSIPFQMSERMTCENQSDPFFNTAFNRNYFVREDLRNEIFEIEAPDSYNISTPDAPVLCFILDISLESTRINLMSSVLASLNEILKSINHDQRTKACFMFFNESVYILNKNQTFSVYNGREVPLVLSEKFLFNLGKDQENNVSEINFEFVEKYFADKKSDYVNYLLALKLCSQAFRSASLFSFISAPPNFDEGKVSASSSLTCQNPEYRNIAESLVRKNICCNLFVMTRTSVELSSIKIPSQYTGGQIFHYPNYDGTDSVSTSKFYCDLTDYFNRETNSGAVCRIRVNSGILLKDVHGNFYQKGADLFSYSNYNPAHCINFSLEFFNEVKKALYIQIAMAKVSKNGRKLIRVANIMIPVNSVPFYDSCDAYAIAHCLCLQAFYYESKKKQSGIEHLESKTMSIWSELNMKYGKVPENLQILPALINSIMKNIVFRPDICTPADFRGYYMYLFSNLPPKIIDLMIYPLLFNILSDSVVPLPLSLSSIDQNAIYILDTGITIYFYIGKSCDINVVSYIFENTTSGPILFNPPENEFSKYVLDLMEYMMSNRSIKPRFVLVSGVETTVYNEIFFSHLYEDSMYQIPSLNEFRNKLENRNK